MSTQKSWHVANFDNIHNQALIVDEHTGENIAIAYDKDNAPLIAEAPNLLKACEDVLDIINAYSHIPAQFKACGILKAVIDKARMENYE